MVDVFNSAACGGVHWGFGVEMGVRGGWGEVMVDWRGGHEGVLGGMVAWGGGDECCELGAVGMGRKK